MRHCCIFALLFFIPLSAAGGDELLAVASVMNGKSFVLASGDVVRLASIEAPNTEEKADGVHTARPGEPLGMEAKAALTQLLVGRKVRMDYVKGGRDRHNRLIGQVFRDDGVWIEGEMLKQGWAMVYSFADDKPEVIEKMLAAEKEAQGSKRGIWADPYFRVITPPEAEQFVGRFKLVEGKVISVHDYHENTYINFSERWKGNFAVFISHKYTAAFAAMNLPSLVGRTVRVRGWINYHNAPGIDLTHPEQIEVE
jgi:endonuclease YncB( thermonuclease family)